MLGRAAWLGKEKHNAATGCFITGCWGPWGAEATCPCAQDPSRNRIAQWREVTPRQGIVDLSLPLAMEPVLGTYTIEVEGKRHSFSVEEYGMKAACFGLSAQATQALLSLSWESQLSLFLLLHQCCLSLR